MKITINSRAQADWLERGVHQIKVSFVKKGCKGTKVEVLENFLKDGLFSFELNSNLIAYYSPLDAELLDGAVLTQVKEKWIFTSPQVASRCGCGSSFSLSGLPHPGKQLQGEFLVIPGHVSDVDSIEHYSTEGELVRSNQEEHNFETTGLFFSEYISGRYLLPKGKTAWYVFLNKTMPSSEIVLQESDSNVQVRIIILGDPKEVVDIKIIGQIESDNSILDIRILTLAKDAERVKVSILGKVSENCKNYQIQVHQSNIFVGDTGNISGIPGLQIASNDGVAAHSATFHALQDRNMEYLVARGLSVKQAKNLLISAKITDMFPRLDTEYRDRMYTI